MKFLVLFLLLIVVGCNSIFPKYEVGQCFRWDHVLDDMERWEREDKSAWKIREVGKYSYGVVLVDVGFVGTISTKRSFRNVYIHYDIVECP